MPDSVRGAFIVDTPRTAGGFAPSGSLDCGALCFEIAGRDGPALQDSSPSTNNSSLVTRHSSLPGGTTVPTAVWASSLDGKPLAESSRILVSHVTDSKNTGARFDDPACRIWLDYGTTPALMRRGRARIELELAPCTGTEPDPQNSSLPDGENNSSLVTRHSSLPGTARVFRLSSSGHRVAEVPSEVLRSPNASILSFTADTAYDPASATLYYEIVR